jgi:hypothetical protein
MVSGVNATVLDEGGCVLRATRCTRQVHERGDHREAIAALVLLAPHKPVGQGCSWVPTLTPGCARGITHLADGTMRRHYTQLVAGI